MITMHRIPTLKTIFKHHQFAITDGMAKLATLDVSQLDYRTLNAPGVGTTSLTYTALALAKEVMRLQRIIDDACSANAALVQASTYPHLTPENAA